ncbi:MAG: HEAT repeat domain-containing protein [Planctomycetota bacterium]
MPFLHPLLLILGLLACAGCLTEPDRSYPDRRIVAEPTAPPPGPAVLLADPVPAAEPPNGLDRCLIFIPGVETGSIEDALRWLDHVRRAGGYGCAILLDWQAGNAWRRLLTPGVTAVGAEEFLDCLTWVRARQADAVIDVLAHSGGTVVLTKAAAAAASPGLDLRHVLLLGTPHSAEDVVDPLLRQTAVVRNVWSRHDAINRRLAAGDGRLPDLRDSPVHGNTEISSTIAGRPVRHETVLEDGPDMARHWGLFLSSGHLPQPEPWVVGPVRIDGEDDLARLHRAVLALREQPDTEQPALHAALPTLLFHPDLEARAYAVMAVGLLKDIRFLPGLRRLLQDPETPAWLRRTVYRAFGNLRLPELVEDLRWAREHDPANAVVTRDLLRELKRERIEPQR